MAGLQGLLDRGVELGFLYSRDSEGPRFVSKEWLADALRCLRGPMALHVCGPAARRELVAGHLRQCMPYLSRVQVNGNVGAEELPELAKNVPHLITQFSEGNEALAKAEIPRHSLLVDASSGLGISPDAWSAPVTKKAVGYAGGLGPANLDIELPRIAVVARAGWWIDMENSLRDGKDRFDLTRALQAVECVRRFADARALAS